VNVNRGNVVAEAVHQNATGRLFTDPGKRSKIVKRILYLPVAKAVE
jgi:hypothetical protein